MVLKNIKITVDQESSLADLVEMIIPKTTMPGAKDISAHLFAIMMVDECYDPEGRKEFMSGLIQFESIVYNRYGNSFTKCTRHQKEEFLNALESRDGISEEQASFYNSMKKLTIESFITSQYFLTKVHVYELVPSRFHGCVPVTRTN